MTKDDDGNVVVLPNAQFTPYAIARKILSFIKEGHEGLRVRGIVAFVTIENAKGLGVVPFNSNVPLTDMALINLAAQTLGTQYMIVAQGPIAKGKDEPPEDEGA